MDLEWILWFTQLTCNDRTPAVIGWAMEKLGVEGKVTDYDLVYHADGKSNVVIYWLRCGKEL
jgi:hypothetical protein